MSNKVDLIYEDKDVLVCHKPAGVATQTRKIGQKDVESLLRSYLAKKKEGNYVAVVHRLDQPVEGLLVLAKNAKAAAALSEQMKEHRIGKYYMAIGLKQEESALTHSGQLVDYMISDPKNNIAQICSHDDPNAKKAILDYEVVKQVGKKVLFKIELHTGRHHQIRVQFANMKCPLWGDVKYGGEVCKTPNHHVALCAYRLQFEHPTTKKMMDFKIRPSGPLFKF